MFENVVLRGMFGSRREEVIGRWRNLRNKELRSFHSTPYIISMNKSRRVRCMVHVEGMAEIRNAVKFCLEEKMQET